MHRCLDECRDIFQVESLLSGRTHPDALPPRDVDIPTFLARDTRRQMDAGTPGPQPLLSLSPDSCPARLFVQGPSPPQAAAARAHPSLGQPWDRAHGFCAAGTSRPALWQGRRW